jgi:hypothetical protein
MGIPYLNSDETMLLSTHNILADAAVAEAILTNRRLLIVESDSTRSRHKEIPFAAIETVTSMESGSGDPAISLAILKKSGGTEPMHLVFTQPPRSKRTGERDDWAQRIKEQVALLPAGTAPEYVDFTEYESEEQIGDTSGSTPAAAEDKNLPAASRPKRKAPLSSRFHPPEAQKSGRKTLLAASAVIIVILLVAGAAFIYPAFLSPNPGTPSTPAPTQVSVTETPVVPATTAAPAAEPAATPAIMPEEIPALQPTAVTTSPPQIIGPGNGVWVRVSYDNNYSGTLGTSGRMREVSGTGEQYYQVPARSNDIVDISIQKLDTSGSALTVDVFNNGELIKSMTIVKPSGTLDMNVVLKPMPAPTVIPTATQ